jgi:hypothetical protein
MVTVKVPPYLWIGGVENAVEFRPGLISGSGAQGQSCDNLATLQLDLSLKHSQRVEVFLHECLHRIQYTLGWGVGGMKGNVLTEQQTVALGHALAALCRELDIKFDFGAVPALR